MKKKAIARLVIILIVSIAIFAFAELLIKHIINMYTENKERQDYVDNVPKVSEIQKKREETFISYTNEIVNLIGERDYEKIYSYFSREYKLAKYPTLQDFEKRMNGILKDGSVIDIVDKVKYSNRYYAIISVDGKEEIQLTVNYDDNEKIENVTFENIYSIYAADYICYADSIELKMTYAINYIDHIGYVFEIKNTSNEIAIFDIEKSYVYTRALVDEKRFDSISQSDMLKIGSGEVVRLEMEFPVVYGDLIKPDKLYLRFRFDDVSYKYTFDVSFENEDFSM